MNGPAPLPKEGTFWEHARGSTYVITGACRLEKMWQRGVLYRGVLYRPVSPPDEDDGLPIARELDDFLRRFTELPGSPLKS